MVVLALLLVFAAIALLVLAFTWRSDGALLARMAALRGGTTAIDPYAKPRPESFGSRLIAPTFGAIAGKLALLLPARWVQAIDEQLLRAGQPLTRVGFLIVVLLSGGSLSLLGLMLVTAGGSSSMMAFMVAGACIGLGLYLPKIWLSARVRQRQAAILKSLPDAFDLITVCVEAGLGLDAALARVAEKVEGPFAEELTITLREVSMGKLRREALKELAHRTGVQDLSSFNNAVVQAETMGTSIAAVLRVQADQMRIRRRQRAEQQAHQAPVKMMFPLVLCIFPTLFVVILGPAGITLFRELGSK